MAGTRTFVALVAVKGGAQPAYCLNTLRCRHSISFVAQVKRPSETALTNPANQKCSKKAELTAD
jgi:hypothetical protein